jgi:hypothetical protein
MTDNGRGVEDAVAVEVSRPCLEKHGGTISNPLPPPLFSFSSPLDVGPCANRSEPSRSSYGLHLPEVCIGWTSTRPGLARVSKPCSR